MASVGKGLMGGYSNDYPLRCDLRIGAMPLYNVHDQF